MTIPFFQTNANLVKPYALMDLDDTLFQTQRKIDAWELPSSEPEQLICASVNKQGEPLSFMTGRQATFFNWLLVSTELIVVTARDTEEVKRVKLPFDSWQVLTHGAVIIQPNGERLTTWQATIDRVLLPLQAKLKQLIEVINAFNLTYDEPLKLAIHSDHTDSLASKIHFQNESPIIYLAVKHKQKNHEALANFAKQLPTLVAELYEDFYVHVNANNLAILPHAIHKRHAVSFLLQSCLDKMRPSFGFGDSLADLPYLQQLDWYGTPNHGQLHDAVDAL